MQSAKEDHLILISSTTGLFALSLCLPESLWHRQKQESLSSRLSAAGDWTRLGGLWSLWCSLTHTRAHTHTRCKQIKNCWRMWHSIRQVRKWDNQASRQMWIRKMGKFPSINRWKEKQSCCAGWEPISISLVVNDCFKGAPFGKREREGQRDCLSSQERSCWEGLTSAHRKSDPLLWSCLWRHSAHSHHGQEK